MAHRNTQRARFSVAFVAGLLSSTVLIGVALAVFSVLDLPKNIEPQDSYPISLPTETGRSQSLVDTNSPKDLKGLDNFGSGFERMAVLRQLLASTDQARVLKLLDQSDDIENSYFKLQVQVEIFRRLAKFNPRLAATRAMTYSRNSQKLLLPAVIGEWTNSDMETAVAYLGMLDRSSRPLAMKSLLFAVERLGENDLQKIADTISYDGALTGLFEEFAVESAIHDPEASWNSVKNDSWYNGSQIESLAAIAEAWVDRDGWNILDGLVESIHNPSVRAQLLQRLLARLARHDPERAFKQAERLLSSSSSTAFLPIVDEWTRQSPVAAYEAISSLDHETLQGDLQLRVIESWARSNPRTLVEYLPRLSEDIQAIARMEAIQGIARVSPQEAIELMSMEHGDIGMDVATSVGYWLSQNDVREALNWALTDSRIDEHRFYVLARILPELVTEDLDLAIQTALDQPVTRRGRALESYIVRSLIAFERIDEAISILPRVRDGPAKQQAYAEVGVNLVLNGHLQESFTLAEDLDGTQREEYFQTLLSEWAGKDPQGLANSLEQISNQTHKLQAAILLRHHRENLLESQWQRVASAAPKK